MGDHFSVQIVIPSESIPETGRTKKGLGAMTRFTLRFQTVYGTVLKKSSLFQLAIDGALFK